MAPPPQKLLSFPPNTDAIKAECFTFSGMFLVRLHKLRRGNSLTSADNAACFSFVSPTDTKMFGHCGKEGRAESGRGDEMHKEKQSFKGETSRKRQMEGN